MKTKLIPFVFFLLAILGAVASNSINRSAKTLTSIPGYVKGNPPGTICSRSIWCSDIPGPICMSGLTQIYGKDAAGNCVLTLYADTFK